jgi:DNA-binding MarR family transcriptional regulator
LTRERKNNASLDESTSINYGVLDDLFGYSVRRAQLAVFEDFERKITSKYGVSTQRYAALELIRCNPGISQTHLAEAMKTARPNVAVILKQLLKQHYIERLTAKDDNRRQELFLTRAGEQALEAMTKDVMVHDRYISRNLTPDEKVQFVALLEKVRVN